MFASPKEKKNHTLPPATAPPAWTVGATDIRQSIETHKEPN
jgi:hypothetical protein